MRHYQNNGKIWTSAKPNKIYIIRKVLLRAIQKYDFIEFESLCQKLWTFLSNFGLFLRCLLTKYGHVLFCPNSTVNIRKSHKISSGKALFFGSYQQKPHGERGTENNPPAPLGLN